MRDFNGTGTTSRYEIMVEKYGQTSSVILYSSPQLFLAGY